MDEPSLEERLAVVLRGVQRMADSLGGIEARLGEVAGQEQLKSLADRVDEYRVRGRTEVSQLGDVVTALAQAVDVLLREQQKLTSAPPPAPPTVELPDLDHLTEAIRGLRDDLAESHRLLREDTERLVEKVAGEQAERALRIHDYIGEASAKTITALGSLGGTEEVVALTAELQQLRTALDGRHVVVTEAITALKDELVAVVEQVRALPTEVPVPPAPEPYDDRGLRALITELRDDLGRLQGELLATAGQLQLDAGADAATTREQLLEAVMGRLATWQPPAPNTDVVLERLASLEARLPQPTSLEPVLLRLTQLEARLAEPPPAADAALQRLLAIEAKLDERTATGAAAVDAQSIYDRLGGIEWRLGERLDPMDERLQRLEQRLDRLVNVEQALELVAQRDDLRRGVDRVIGAVSSAEQAVTGEVRGVDARLGAMTEDLRFVRVLRDRLDALAEGIDGVRQLAARSATSQQMSDVTNELGSVLREIESARSQVLHVEQAPSPVEAEVVAVHTEVDSLGQRIDQLAETIEKSMRRTPAQDRAAGQQVATRLRQVSETARLLGNGVLEDLRTRRARR